MVTYDITVDQMKEIKIELKSVYINHSRDIHVAFYGAQLSKIRSLKDKHRSFLSGGVVQPIINCYGIDHIWKILNI